MADRTTCVATYFLLKTPRILNKKIYEDNNILPPLVAPEFRRKFPAMRARDCAGGPVLLRWERVRLEDISETSDQESVGATTPHCGNSFSTLFIGSPEDSAEVRDEFQRVGMGQY